MSAVMMWGGFTLKRRHRARTQSFHLSKTKYDSNNCEPANTEKERERPGSGDAFLWNLFCEELWSCDIPAVENRARLYRFRVGDQRATGFSSTFDLHTCEGSSGVWGQLSLQRLPCVQRKWKGNGKSNKVHSSKQFYVTKSAFNGDDASFPKTCFPYYIQAVSWKVEEIYIKKQLNRNESPAHPLRSLEVCFISVQGVQEDKGLEEDEAKVCFFVENRLKNAWRTLKMSQFEFSARKTRSKGVLIESTSTKLRWAT